LRRGISKPYTDGRCYFGGLSIRATNQADAAAFVASVRSGDEVAFAAITEPYRRQLHVHCYRMLGSFDEAEDLVQETLLRAWRGRAGFEGRSTVRTWLYRIATNACLDLLESKSRRIQSLESPQSAESYEVDWLQPYPDRLLDQIASSDSEPDALVIARETIELAYLAAIQFLPPKHRAILILRDALGWSAKETANLLDESVASVNSALHRARSSMRKRLPERRLEWSASRTPTTAERKLLERYMDATDRADVVALTALLREEVRLTMPPYPTWFQGREEIATAFALSTDPSSPTYLGQFRTLATAANRQLAVAAYVRRPGDSEYRALGVDVLRLEGDLVVEITRFVNADLFAAFGLPPTL
jgi:RNA polymerase sigma-70 factor (ECF subfamily)